MADRYSAFEIYSTRIPLRGWTSLPLVGIAAVLVVALPEARALVLGGLLGGATVAAALIVRRSRAR
jgi:hypothetical protein